MVAEESALALPGEILLQCMLLPFCSPNDLARVLAASRGLRSLRQACVASVLAKLFEGPGAANGISWIRLRHADKLDDIGLIDWLCKIKDTAVSGAYRASVGENHSVVITPGGRALAAGSGRNGALGESTNMNSFLFTEVDLRWGRFPGRIPVAAVACGHQHTLFLTAAGTVHSCGLGEYGRLGHGDRRSLSRPTLIEALVEERIAQVAAGAAHSVAVSWKGEAFTWGWGFMGTLGHGNDLDCFRPVRVTIPDYVVLPDIPAGAASTSRSAYSTAGAGFNTTRAVGTPDSPQPTPGSNFNAAGGVGTPGITQCPSGDDSDAHGTASTLRSMLSTPGVVDTPGATGAPGSRQSTPGADDSTGCVARRVNHRVTCAAATLDRTVLGTSSGRVLISTLLDNPSVSTGVGLFEIGRLSGGLQCRRVEISQYVSPRARSVFVIDSAGHAHAFPVDGAKLKPSFASSHADEWWRCFGDSMSVIGGSVSMSGGGVNMDYSGGNGDDIVGGGQACGQKGGLHPDMALKTGLAMSSRLAMSLVKCSSIFVSPREIDFLDCSFCPDGMAGWGPFKSIVIISTDGCLMTADANTNGVRGLRRRRGDGVVCAAIGVVAKEPYGLLVVDGGASLLTWGNVNAGQLGHGHSHQVRTPTVVTSAFILGSTLLRTNGSRSSNVRVSLANDRQHIRPPAPGDGGGINPATKRPRREARLLALVDAAADERDFKEEALARERDD